MTDLGTAGFCLTAATLGLSGGIAPGPLSALVVRESLRYGWRSGAIVALAPVMTDAPLLFAGAWLSGTAPQLGSLNALVSFIGAAFLAFMAWESWNTREVSLQSSGRASYQGAAIRGVLTNLLSPHPYLFWGAVGGPLLDQAWTLSVVAALGFVALFFATLCGSKIVLAWLVGQQRERLGGPIYVWVQRSLAVALLAFAFLFLRHGLEHVLH